MITNFSKIVNESLGSSLSLPAHGRVGARATSTLAAHFALQNTHSKSAEKRIVGSEGEAEGGCGGNSASPEPKRSPATLLGESRPTKKSFVFLLEEKIGRAQIKNCKQNFSLAERAKRAVAGRSESLVVLLKKCSNFVQKTPPIFQKTTNSLYHKISSSYNQTENINQTFNESP